MCVYECVSVFVLSGAAMAAVGAVPSVPAPWSWKWFVTIAWWTCSLLPKRCVTLSQTWWKQWWVCRGPYLSILQHIISHYAATSDWECKGTWNLCRKSVSISNVFLTTLPLWKVEGKFHCKTLHLKAGWLDTPSVSFWTCRDRKKERER